MSFIKCVVRGLLRHKEGEVSLRSMLDAALDWSIHDAS